MIYFNDEQFEAPLSVAAEMYADQMVALQQASAASSSEGPQGSGKGRGGGGTQETGSNPAVFGVGELSLYEVLTLDGANPSVACSDLQNNRHYTVAVELAEETYAGAAYSDVSTYPTGFGRLTDWTTGQTTSYNLQVHYGGVGDFFCTEYPGPGGRILLQNTPTFLAGFVIGATD